MSSRARRPSLPPGSAGTWYYLGMQLLLGALVRPHRHGSWCHERGLLHATVPPPVLRLLGCSSTSSRRLPLAEATSGRSLSSSGGASSVDRSFTEDEIYLMLRPDMVANLSKLRDSGHSVGGLNATTLAMRSTLLRYARPPLQTSHHGSGSRLLRQFSCLYGPGCEKMPRVGPRATFGSPIKSGS